MLRVLHQFHLRHRVIILTLSPLKSFHPFHLYCHDHHKSLPTILLYIHFICLSIVPISMIISNLIARHHFFYVFVHQQICSSLLLRFLAIHGRLFLYDVVYVTRLDDLHGPAWFIFIHYSIPILHCHLNDIFLLFFDLSFQLYLYVIDLLPYVIP